MSSLLFFSALCSMFIYAYAIPHAEYQPKYVCAQDFRLMTVCEWIGYIIFL